MEKYNDLQQAVIEFLSKNQLDYKILPMAVTLALNAYLKNFWQGSTDKINWQKLHTNHQTINFTTPITDRYVKHLINHSNFKLLNPLERLTK